MKNFIYFWLFVEFATSFTLGVVYEKDAPYEDKCTQWMHYDIIIDKDQIKADSSSKLMLPKPESLGSVSFKDCINQNGWAELQMETYSSSNNTMQAYVAGYAEGVITKNLISYQYQNTMEGFCNSSSDYCDKLHQFLSENLNFMLRKIKDNPHNDYWQQVYYVLLQAQGLQDGYYRNSIDLTIRLKPFSLMFLNLFGDLEDLQTALKQGTKLLGSGSCSALIKLLPNYQDLYVSHDTWNEYNGMLRIIKKTTLNFKDQQGNVIAGHTSSFSSQPGSLYSGDDFYVLSSGLTVIETTIGNDNDQLWKYVTSQGVVLEWIRNIVANRLATNGQHWADIFKLYNSGTYNNQWMVVDYNKFTPGKQPDSGLLTVLEQIPGMIEYADVTNILLQQTYWASYNVPYFSTIFEENGSADNVRKYGDWFTHDKTPRALIFKRDHHKVKDIKTMIQLMRYNDFEHDPLSRCNCTPSYSGENTIAARSDLNLRNGTYPLPVFAFRLHGATDMKFTNYQMQKNYELIAECGPTHDQQPVFNWKQVEFLHISHVGLPDSYNFSPVHIKWPTT